MVVVCDKGLKVILHSATLTEGQGRSDLEKGSKWGFFHKIGFFSESMEHRSTKPSLLNSKLKYLSNDICMSSAKVKVKVTVTLKSVKNCIFLGVYCNFFGENFLKSYQILRSNSIQQRLSKKVALKGLDRRSRSQ